MNENGCLLVRISDNVLEEKEFSLLLLFIEGNKVVKMEEGKGVYRMPFMVGWTLSKLWAWLSYDPTGTHPEQYNQVMLEERWQSAPSMSKLKEGLQCRMVLCPYCGMLANLVRGKTVYPHREDLGRKRFWVCFSCDARVGCHKSSDEPLGRLANNSLRKAKMRAHEAFDPLWKRELGGKMKRKEAYAWLAESLGIPLDECHIGMFDEDTCKKVVALSLRESSGME